MRVGLSRLCTVALLVGWLVCPGLGAAEPPQTPILATLDAELQRTLSAFGERDPAPYFLGYEITESQTVNVVGSFGSLLRSSRSNRRQLDIDLRVGDYALDNTHPLRDDRSFRPQRTFIAVPIEDDPDAMASVIWLHTDRAYKDAIEDLTKVRTNVQVKVEQEDRSADLSREEPRQFLEQRIELGVEPRAWEERVRRITAPFAVHDEIYQAQADFTATVVTRWLVTSEGSKVRVSEPLFRLQISAFSKADDGMELPRYETFVARSRNGLPDDDALLRTVEQMIQDLLALREAPVVDPYTGPAILSGRAAGVFFHEVFGHRIEGHRQKREEEGQTFKKKIGQRILPDDFDVFSDPTQTRLEGVDLAGHYRYDNEGVKAQRVEVVTDGVFRAFLMSRSPIEGFPHSNGHGRREPGYRAVSRQSNLIVETSGEVDDAELERRLLALIRDEDRPFGLIFEDIQGGFTVTGRALPNAFNVLPVMVYRLLPDGTRELVRGVDLIGTPLTAFTSIVSAGKQRRVFNGTCGAESGGVAVSAVAPPLLIRQIEVQKKDKSQDRPPILPAPSGEAEGS